MAMILKPIKIGARKIVNPVGAIECQSNLNLEQVLGLGSDGIDSKRACGGMIRSPFASAIPPPHSIGI
ncbi:hypothetical protein EUGRSUZ_B00257 [Eucalyptus grandis]|uniref:Uncharacterized protein n=2 Tax=Eucalyptus grandis TaxID=71139 RepID=A0ACC3LNL8_EUCGR|nr:hypothetical protein EUGRSUZ_B00257 [Eucalyptus grandis]